MVPLRSPALTAHRIRHLVQAVLLTAIIGGTVVGCSNSSDPEPAAAAAVNTRALAPPNTSDSLLYVARAAKGTLKVGKGTTGTLTLEGLEAVTWFSDRPDRDAGTTKVTDALGTFDWHANGDALSDDPPNATLVAAELGTDVVVVELLTATVDAKQVSFEVRRITDAWPARGTLTNIDLFIDNASVYPFTVQTALQRGVTATTTVWMNGPRITATITFTSPDWAVGHSLTVEPYETGRFSRSKEGRFQMADGSLFMVDQIDVFPPDRRLPGTGLRLPGSVHLDATMTGHPAISVDAVLATMPITPDPYLGTPGYPGTTTP